MIFIVSTLPFLNMTGIYGWTKIIDVTVMIIVLIGVCGEALRGARAKQLARRKERAGKVTDLHRNLSGKREGADVGGAIACMDHVACILDSIFSQENHHRNSAQHMASQFSGGYCHK